MTQSIRLSRRLYIRVCLWIPPLLVIALGGGLASAQERDSIFAVPQSHIDVVWLWRFDPETIHRCCKPTFTQATDNMALFPNYTFSQSQVPLYEATERVYPELFRKIERYVREGRWEIVGGMYVEPEGGEPCGESLVRQCVMGKRYFKQRFGVEVTTGWQADAWSHPWQLPQILQKSGMNSYMFHRGSRGESLFWWQSPDGSRVLACRPLSNRPVSEWGSYLDSLKKRYGVNAAMVEVGGGDHGGGADAAEIQRIEEFARASSPDIDVKFSSFSRYVTELLARKPELPVVNTELGFELQGDLTNCGEIKKGNREGENLLLDAEKWCSVASLLFGEEYPAEELDEAWRKLLFNQFHDILGGSLIPPAIEDAMPMYRSVRESAQYTMGKALDSVAKRVDTQGAETAVVVFNALAWERTDVVCVDIKVNSFPDSAYLRDSSGENVPLQIVERKEEKGRQRVRFLFLAEKVPGMGYKTYHLVSGECPGRAVSALGASSRMLENEFLRVEVDPVSGWVSRIFDKRHKREVLDDSGKGNRLIAIGDDGDSEGRFIVGKDVAGHPTGESVGLDSPPVIYLVENGPVRAVLRVERPFGKSRFMQEICLSRGVPRVDFRIEIDWHDTHTMMKVAFPCALDNPEITYDVPYGTISRPADGDEYPAQKWVDLFADGYGVGLLNDARYAHDVRGNEVRMSLLRSPTQPAENTDEGIHTLGYSIYPHKGDWKEADTMRRGYEFNHPMLAVTQPSHQGSLPLKSSFLATESRNVVIEVVKSAYDPAGMAPDCAPSSDAVIRLCEMHGKAGTVRLRLPLGIQTALETDLLERPLRELPVSDQVVEVPVAPYEIKTVRLTLKRN